MLSKICLYTESLQPPMDEGMKIFTYHIFQEAAKMCDVLRLGHGDPSVIDIQIETNKLLLSRRMRKAVRDYKPDSLIYIPTSAATSASFIRGRVLKSYAGNVPLAIISLQPRQYSNISSSIINALSPDVIYVQSQASVNLLRKAGLNAKVVYAGVDTGRFRPVTSAEKNNLRNKYNIDKGSYVALHVGHIREGRNISELAKITSLPGVQVVLIGSSSTSHDDGIEESLTLSGVRVIGDYIESIEEIYQLADVYIFPVTKPNAAIELPLSVLEAMACNLPVVTTKFGGLTDCFEEGGGLYFIDGTEHIADGIEKAKRYDDVRTRAMVQPFTWPSIAQRLLTEIGEINAADSLQKSAK